MDWYEQEEAEKARDKELKMRQALPLPEELFNAVENPDSTIERIRELAKSADCRAVNQSKQNLLHITFQRCAHPEHLAEMTEIFVSKGADVNGLDYNFVSPLAYCVLNGNKGLRNHEYRKKARRMMDPYQFERSRFERAHDLFADLFIRGRRRKYRDFCEEYMFPIENDDDQIKEDQYYQDQVLKSLRIMLEGKAETSHAPAVIPSLVHSGTFGGSFDHILLQTDSRMHFGGFEESTYRTFDPLTRSDHDVNRNGLHVFHLSAWRGDARFLKVLQEYKAYIKVMASDGRYGFQFVYQYCNKPADLPEVTDMFIKADVPMRSVTGPSMLGLGDLLRHVFMKRSFLKYLAVAYTEDICYVDHDNDNYHREIKECIHMLFNPDIVKRTPWPPPGAEREENKPTASDKTQDGAENAAASFDDTSSKTMAKRAPLCPTYYTDIPWEEKLKEPREMRDDVCLISMYKSLRDRLRHIERARRGPRSDGRPSPFDLSSKPLPEFTEIILRYNINVDSTDHDEKTALYYLVELWIQLVEMGRLEEHRENLVATIRLLLRYGANCNHKPKLPYLPNRPAEPSQTMITMITLLRCEKGTAVDSLLELLHLLVEGGGDLAGFDWIGWITGQIDVDNNQNLPPSAMLCNLSRNACYAMANGIAPYEPEREEEYAARVFIFIFAVARKFNHIKLLPGENVPEKSGRIALLQLVNVLINVSCEKVYSELRAWYTLKRVKLTEHGENPGEVEAPDVLQIVKNAKELWILLGVWLSKPRNLQHHCRRVIWRALGKNFNKVDQLELPKALIEFIRDFVRPQLPQ